MPIAPRYNPYSGGAPTPPDPEPSITSVTSGAPGQVTIHGQLLDGSDSARLVGTPALDASIYNPDGPNAGFNPMEITVVFSDETIVIDGLDDLAGAIIEEAHLRNEAFEDIDVLTGLSVTITGPPPTLTALFSPGPDTIRAEGTGFDPIQRLSFGFSNGSMFVYGPSDPDPDTGNSGSGITITEWSDTVIEFQCPFAPTGTCLAVDLQSQAPSYVTVVEFLNSNIDPDDGFPPFSVA